MNNNSNLEFRKIKSLDFLYEINENGTIFRNVKSKKQNKIKLDKHHSESGYYVVFCRFKGKTKRVMIHMVVAECWLGDCPNGYEVDYIDRNTHNNHYSNLRYIPKSKQDHSNISKKESSDSEYIRMKPVQIIRDGESHNFESYASCARYLSDLYNTGYESIRYKLKHKRSHIHDYDVIYLNAETIHGSSMEQEIVHKM